MSAAERAWRAMRRAPRYCIQPWRIAVGAPILLNLVLLAPQLQNVDPYSDSVFHIAMVRWAQRKIAAGQLPLDGWFPNFTLGASQFHHYQSLPAILSAYLSGPLGAASTYRLSVYLLMSFWPLTIYWGARLMGRSRGEASIAALFSPFLASAATFGFEANSYVYRGYGLWTQLWGMFLLPLAWGLTWRSLYNRGRAAWPSLVVALTLACAFITGYMAFLGIGVFALVTREQWRAHLLRAALLAGCAVLIASWTLVPLVSDQAYTTNVNFAGKLVYDAWGVSQVIPWLIQGQLFDNNNLPVISLLAAAGAGLVIRNWRHDYAGRGILVLTLLSLLLIIGPATFPWLRLLPGGQDLQFSRFLGCVQLCALLLAGIGGGYILAAGERGLLWLKGRVRVLAGTPRPVVTALLALASAAVVLSPTLALIDYESGTNTVIAYQAEIDATRGNELQPLLAVMTEHGPGRVYAGALLNWGNANIIGQVPVFEELSNRDVDQIGYTGRVQSLSNYPEYYFNETSVANYNAFAVHYLIYPLGTSPPVPARRLATSGNNVLWEVTGVKPGYVRVVDTIPPPVVADKKTLETVSPDVLNSSDFAQGYFHPVAFAGMPAAAPSLPQGPATGSPGNVQHETDDLDNGDVVATVKASRAAVALLSVSYDNRWTVTVDGAPAPTQMIAPTLLGVAVGPGSHLIHFHYQQYALYWLWFLTAALTIVGLFWGRRLSRRMVRAWRPRRAP